MYAVDDVCVRACVYSYLYNKKLTPILRLLALESCRGRYFWRLPRRARAVVAPPSASLYFIYINKDQDPICALTIQISSQDPR